MLSIPSLVSRARTRFAQESSIRWLDSEFQTSLREGSEDLAEATGFYERYINLRAKGTQMYFDLRGLLPETAIIVTKVWSEATNRWLSYVSPKTLDGIYPRWDQITPGGTSNWLMRGMNWFGVFPRLAVGNGVRIYYQGVPSFSIPDLLFEDDYGSALEEYCLYDLLCQDGDVDKGLVHWNHYLEREASLTSQIDKRVARAQHASLSTR